MHTKYHFASSELLERKEPEDLHLRFTSVQRYELRSPLEIHTGSEEMCFVMIDGGVSYELDTRSETAEFKDMLYTPRNSTIRLTPQGDEAVVMAYGAPAHRETAFAHVPFKEIDANPETHQAYGELATNCRRDVWHFIDDDFDVCRLMMGMCRGKTGGWTAWPPHEHAKQREEVYTYFDMGKAFGIQCVYEEMDDPLTMSLVREGDLISIPKGFHPNTGSPAGPISYIYCMSATKPDAREFLDLHIQEMYGDEFK